MCDLRGGGATGRFIFCNRRNARLCSGAAARVPGTRAVLVPCFLLSILVTAGTVSCQVKIVIYVPPNEGLPFLVVSFKVGG